MRSWRTANNRRFRLKMPQYGGFDGDHFWFRGGEGFGHASRRRRRSYRRAFSKMVADLEHDAEILRQCDAAKVKTFQ